MVIMFRNLNGRGDAHREERTIKPWREKLQNVNADVVVITDDASEAPAGTTPVVLPATGCEFTFPQIAVMFFQLLACCMTIVRGIDPDLAGVINKITITK